MVNKLNASHVTSSELITLVNQIYYYHIDLFSDQDCFQSDSD